MEIYIYTLKHPITDEVRYVGKTINLKRRYTQHLYDKRPTHKGSWIKSLRLEGLKPILDILEVCHELNWIEREKYWISRFDNLTNHLDGGGTNFVKTTKDETRQKISLIHKDKPKTKEHKDKIRTSKLKKPCLINGVIYNSTMEASRELSVPSGTIYNRIISKHFITYQWC